MLGVVGRGQEALHLAVEGRAGAVRAHRLQEALELFYGRRKPREIDAQPAEERCGFGGSSRSDAARREGPENEVVDAELRVPCWNRLEGPVGVVGRASVDPAPEDLDLIVCQGELGLRRRHAESRPGMGDARDELARRRIPWDDRSVPAEVLGRRFERIEPEVRLGVARIGPVALEAAVREDRLDVAREVDAGGCVVRLRRRRQESEEDVDEHGTSLHRVFVSVGDDSAFMTTSRRGAPFSPGPSGGVSRVELSPLTLIGFLE